MENKKNKITIEQSLNLELLHVYYSLEDLLNNNVPNNVKDKIQELIFYIDNILFKDIPNGYDIDDRKAFLKFYLSN